MIAKNQEPTDCTSTSV